MPDEQHGQAAPPPGSRIGAPAPRFVCRTTMGERSLDDYRGRWLVFFSHPADFTPVCTSGFLAFARLQPAFDPDRLYHTRKLETPS